MKNNHNDRTKEYKNPLRRVLILVASIITAIAVAVACAICMDVTPAVDVDAVDPGEVSSSTTYTNKQGNLTGAGAIKNGDLLDYTGNTVYSVTLPKGTYKLFVWGAQGSSNGSRAGGLGGYATGTYTITATSQTLYVVPGSRAGYNGGGSSSYPGGGASHISRASGTINNSTVRSNMVIAAGGGGGAGANTGGAGGGGGGGNGVAGSASSWAKGGGAGTTGGGGSGGSPYSGQTAGSSGSAGQGGAGGTTTRGGGGGGGWYGGGGGGGDISGSSTSCGGGGGGGGSGYTGGVTGASTASSNRSGGGMARIQVVQVNQAPVSQNKTYQNTSAASYFRGTSRNISIYAYDLAKDNDYANISGATNANGVYFTNGSSSNYDTMPANNAGLYLNSGCSTSASAYLSWTWVNNQTLRIDQIKKYPRNGADGCTANGRLTLYTKVRDRFGSTTTRGVSVATFYFYVNDKPITPAGDTFKSVKRTESGVTYEYRYGNPTSTGPSNALLDHMGNAKSIYNPVAGATNKTVFLPKPIAPTDTAGYKIYASDIFGDADTSYDKVGFKSVSVTSGYTNYSNYYTVSYNSDSTYASGVVPSITIKPTSLRPTSAIYVCLTITAQTSETASKVAIGSANTAVRLVFRIANTRPYFASSTAINTGLSEPYIELEPGQAKTLSIASMIKDIDDAALGAYFVGNAGVKVPDNEYIQVDMSNNAVQLKSGNYSAFMTQINKTAGKLSSSTGEGTTATGFKKDVVAAAGSAGAANAAVLYSFDNNKTIRFTARTATNYMYKQANRLGDFYIMVRVVDPADVADTGIWYPIAIKVKSSAPAELPTVANFSLAFNGFESGSYDTPTTEGSDVKPGTPGSVILTPLSYVDSKGVVQGVGTTNDSFNEFNGHANPFTIDPDTFAFSGTGLTNYEKTRALNDMVMLDINMTPGMAASDVNLASVVELYDTSSFFDVKIVSLHANRSVFSRLSVDLASFGVREYKDVNNDIVTAGYEFFGLQITPLRSTGDEYFQIGIKVKDSHGVKKTVRVCINVQNRAVQARRDQSTGTAYKLNPGEYGKYVQNNSIGAYAVNYTIERNDVIQITPYDLVYDLDIDPKNTIMNKTALNTNPSNGGFADVAAYLNKTYNVPHTASPSSPASAASAVYGQRLTFTNTANFLANAGQYSTYISASIESACTYGNSVYAVPCVKITGLSRTTSAVVQLRFTVSDGYSETECLVTVTVKNSKPQLNTAEVNPDGEYHVLDVYTMSVKVGAGLVDTYQLTASQLAYDKDGGDIPTFKPTSTNPRAVVKVGDAYFPALKYTSEEDHTLIGAEDDDKDAVIRLSDYIQVMLTKNSLGEDVLYFRALSSTETLQFPVYVEFLVQDGFRAQPEENLLHVLVNVKNSMPEFVTDNLLMTNTETEDYSWQIAYEDKSETKVARYIFNSKELSESGTIATSASNRIWLFDDADGLQNVMLNPVTWPSTGSNYVDGLIVQQTAGTRVDENAFKDHPNAAIIYTPTYPSEKDSSISKFLKLELLFFEKIVNEDGVSKFVKLDSTDSKILTTQYWALAITDEARSNATSIASNIAIAIRDDHDGTIVYDANKVPQKVNDKDALHNTAVNVFNFFYSYKTPGITAMHTYYRNDGNAEANTLISEAGKDHVYAIDVKGFDTNYQYQFDNLPGGKLTQDALKEATFTNRFRYQYFSKTITRTDEDGETTVEVTNKYFPDEKNAFYYEPIQVAASSAAKTLIPMSYIAMPKASDAGTGLDKSHVSFANSTPKPNTEADKGYPLSDHDYINWGSAKNLPYVFENLTLSDTDGGTWTGKQLNENPYITIGYEANALVLNTDKVNKKRFRLVASGESNTVGRQAISVMNSDGSSIYLEDKYGFTFEKKKGGRRSTGMLKLTLALKTCSYAENVLNINETEYVEVEINLANSEPKVKYNGTELPNGYTDKINLEMTTSMIAGAINPVTGEPYKQSGKIVSLIKESELADKTGDYQLVYTDPDVTDTMKFLLGSATANLTESEREYITATSNINHAANAYESYYDVLNSAQMVTWTKEDGTTEEITIAEYKRRHVPNPGYDTFFDVTPSDGSSSTIQFIPKAKTQLNISKDATADERKAILDKYHLKEDANNNIYYPFKILFYDEVNGSPFTSGNWGLAIVNVYIGNDKITANKSVVSGTYNGMPKYSFKLSKGSDFFVDVTSLLADNDIKLADGSFEVSDATFEGEEYLFTDYLVMPEPDDYKRLSPSVSSMPKLPITVDKPIMGSGMSESTLKFKTESAFKDEILIEYEFSDSVNKMTGKGGSSAKVVFAISYNNEAPTRNGTTFDGSDAINIVMKTGDEFTLYAADASLFAGDINGGFNSYYQNSKGQIDGHVKAYSTGKNTNGEEMTAADHVEAFNFKSASSYTEAPVGNLGSLIVGSDDAPSTLRISAWDDGTFANPNDRSMFEITTGARYAREKSGSNLPMSVTLKALGVVDTVYSITIVDGENLATTVNINISVLPTAPVAKTNLLPNGMTVVTGTANTTYAISLGYGESREIELNKFMSDIDLDDIGSLEVYKNVDNTYFTIDNPAGVSAIAVENTKVLTQNAIAITATDFVPTEGECSSLHFRVADKHGAVSEFITINVNIEPKEVKTVATFNTDYSITLKSYSEYEADGQPVAVDIVAPENVAKVFSDADVAAPSSRYDVDVYALLKDNKDGTFSTIRQNSEDFIASDCKLLTIRNSKLSSGSGDIYDYVMRFFDLTISADGKTLEFTPNSATISSEGTAKLAAIQLYIVLAKRYTYADGQTAMESRAAYMGVSVANSSLVAVPSSPVNSGYPMITVGKDEEGNDEKRLRESSFLEFTGTAGDSLTWDIYNLKDPDLGLFYDYDLINNPAKKLEDKDVGGLETINYVKAELTGINETVSGKGDVLSVTPSGDGKSLTIKINRKVFTGQPPKDGNKTSYTDVKVDIYCADTIGARAGIGNNSNLVKTTITVRVENDVPEIKKVTDESMTSKLGYAITYSDVDGYNLEAKLERGAKLTVNVADIIDDADIAMDEYVMLYTGSEDSLMRSDGTLMGSTADDGTNDGIGRIKKGNNTLFTVKLVTSSNSYSVSTLSQIVFTCESTLRGTVGTCQIRFRDSVQDAMTRVLNVNITVDNIAPTLKSGANTTVTMMGVGKDGTYDDEVAATKQFSILDFVTDANGDAYLGGSITDEEYVHTYTFVDAMLVYTTADMVNAPTLYGPNLKKFNEDKGEEYITTDVLCIADWAQSDPLHQTFSLMPFAGVYGEQRITITVIDSGYEQGASAGVLDGKSFELNITLIVANPLEDVAETLEGKEIAYGVTRQITVVDLLGEENSRGYEIDSITEADTQYLGITGPNGAGGAAQSAVGKADNGAWSIYARTADVNVNLTVTFRAGGVTRVRTLPVSVIKNNEPVYINDKVSYEFTVDKLTDPVARTLKIYPEDWFNDSDIGDIMRFIDPIKSSQSVIVEAIIDTDTPADGGRTFILLKFNRRGEADITFTLIDLAGTPYEKTIKVNCTDAPSLTWWEKIITLIVDNWMWFWIIVGASLLFLILLIIIIVVVVRKRKMRREIEALLNAETELEEEMLKLSAGASSMPYQSFGYLPPTQNTVGDPGLMLGGSVNNPTPNSLQLNAGTGKPQNAQVPPPDKGAPPPASDGFDPNDF